MKLPAITTEQSDYLLKNNYVLRTDMMDKGIIHYVHDEKTDKVIRVYGNVIELLVFDRFTESFPVKYKFTCLDSFSLEDFKRILDKTGFVIRLKSAVDIAEEKFEVNYGLMLRNELS